MQCPSCSAQNPAEHQFCGSCGQAIRPWSQMATAPGAVGVHAVAVGVGRLISSDSVPVGGLTPGSTLMDRYRIIGLLGRGGMGEVYRADDMKLGQPVALKFLPASLSSDAVRRERFFAEVRIARQLAHPNICRVYDIAEVNGQHFLSMEYIDGEDLASLLKRIGALSNEKALDIARQLMAGLAAAHERGVLHRDLKPANIMIDGRGRVRITDFGLAIAVEDEQRPGDAPGTPAYMAPEQLAGKGASVRSDIYAVGLIVYEILSGKKAFTAPTMAELRAAKEQSTPTAPSEIRAGVDPAVERLVMRCLDRDPKSRPSSVAQLAAALPGGDPLAASIAAGETPSPELVAASGLQEGLRPIAALTLLALFIGGAIAAVAMTPRGTPLGRVKLEKSPDALLDRARDLLRQLGYEQPVVDSASGLRYDFDLLYFARADSSRNWLALRNPVVFWYRVIPEPLTRHDFQTTATFRGITVQDPPREVAGEVLIEFDAEGKFRRLEAIPVAAVSSDQAARAPDWNLMLSLAGFDPAALRASTPQRIPPFFADTRVAWEGALPGLPDVPVRIEAASFGGTPVSFEIAGPWSRPQRRSSTLRALDSRQKINLALSLLLLTLAVAGGLFLANRNLRLGRGDRRGAARLAVFTIVLGGVSWVLVEHHVAQPWEVLLLLMFLARAALLAGLTWVFYIALEPMVRRRWPQVLVSWTRLLSGAWSDPRVGRDVLAGCAAGVAIVCVYRLLSYKEIVPFLLAGTSPEVLGGANRFVAATADLFVQASFLGFGYLCIFVLLRTLIRKEWGAAALIVVIGTVGNQTNFQPTWLSALGTLLVQVLLLVVLMRFGIVAVIVVLYLFLVFQTFPMTFATSAWHASAGFAALAVVAALALYGFRVSLGGRRLLEGLPTD